MRLPTFTHRYPLKYVFAWLLFIFATVLAVVIIMSNAGTSAIQPAGCRQTRYPEVCADSYRKCNNIGLNQACLEVSKLDGYYGYDVMKKGNVVK